MSAFATTAESGTEPVSPRTQDYVAMAVILFGCAINAAQSYEYLQDQGSPILVALSVGLWILAAAAFFFKSWTVGLPVFVLGIVVNAYLILPDFYVSFVVLTAITAITLAVILKVRPGSFVGLEFSKPLLIATALWLVVIGAGSYGSEEGFAGINLDQQATQIDIFGFLNVFGIGMLALLVLAIVLLAFRPEISIGIALLLGFQTLVSSFYGASQYPVEGLANWVYVGQNVLASTFEWIAIGVCAVILIRRLATDVSGAVDPASVSTAPE